jgi:DNA-binding transcriptional LysR family regulator
MTNIPTDLLRALIAVVDLRSFTKAAASLGVTQPAVSAQLKRLQFLLAVELFDRSSPGISLTPQGETVVGHARRLLSINDMIMRVSEPRRKREQVIRVGTPSDFIASLMPSIFARFRERWPDVRFIVRTDYYDPLMRALRCGDLDLCVGLSMEPPRDARHMWAEEVVWARGANCRFDPTQPVPLVSYGESCMYHRLAVSALRSAGLDWEDVFTGPSITSLAAAIAANLGVMAVIRRRAVETGLMTWDGGPLPKLHDLYAGIFVREGGANVLYEQLADEICMVLRQAGPRMSNVTAAALPSRRSNTAA